MNVYLKLESEQLLVDSRLHMLTLDIECVPYYMT